jgi:TPR repeat protein
MLASNTLTASEIARIQRAQAVHLLTLERYQDALIVLDQLMLYDDASDQHHFRRARALQGLDRIGEAKDSVDQALELNPQNVKSLLLRAALNIETDSLDEAVSDAGLAAILAPDNPETNEMLAKALAAVGAIEAAARSAELAATKSVAAEAAAANAIELGFWNDVKNSDTPDEIELFLQTFPNSVFAPLGILRLQRLNAGGGVVPAQPTTVVSLPSTTELEITSGTIGENIAVSSIELIGGQILIGGSRNKDKASNPKGWVALYNNTGGLIWEKILRSEFKRGFVSDVIATQDNKLVVVDIRSRDWGETNSAMLIAYDLSGNELWQHTIGPVTRETGFVSLAPLTDGGLLAVTGTDAEKKLDANSLIIRLDANGNVAWKKTLSIAQEDTALSAAEGDNSIFVVGTLKIEDNDNGNPWVRKFDKRGALVWKRTLRTRKQSFASDVYVLQDGDAIVLGGYKANGNRLNWLARLDPAGTTIWEAEFAVGVESNAFRLAQLPNGKLAVGGTARAGNYGDGPSVGWVLYFDSSGQELARRVFGDHFEETLYDISPTHDGGVLLSGGFNADNKLNQTAWVKRLPPRSQVNGRAFTAESSALLESCVSLASHPSDRQNPYKTKGHSWPDFDAENAEKICKLAAAVFPRNMHATYHLGRVEPKLEKWRRAVELYNDAAEMGHVRAMVGAGVIYSDGPEAFRNPSRAVKNFQMAVEIENDPIAAALLAAAYSNGLGVIKDDPKAVAYYRIAADAGSPVAQYQMGRHYFDGLGVKKDVSVARYWYEKSSDNNHVRASYQFAYFNHWGIGGVAQDRHKAFDLFKKAADGGDPDATLFIADKYRWGGEAVTANEALALRWYQLAIDRGAPPAYANLGFFHQYGKGVTANPRKALELYRKGVKAGAGNSHYYLGKMYQEGVEVDKNLGEAIRLYDIAIEKSNSDAMIALAYLHRDGTGMPKDEKKAYELFQAAAAQFHREGNREAGWLQYLGRGAKKDIRAAVVQIEKAYKQGDDLAAVYLGYIFEVEVSVRDPKRAAKHYYDALSRGHDWPAARPRSNWDRDTARELQVLLRDAGYYNSAIDGAMGAGSVVAMKALCGC